VPSHFYQTLAAIIPNACLKTSGSVVQIDSRASKIRSVERDICQIAALYVAFNLLCLTLRTVVSQQVYKFILSFLDHMTSSVT